MLMLRKEERQSVLVLTKCDEPQQTLSTGFPSLRIG